MVLADLKVFFIRRVCSQENTLHAFKSIHTHARTHAHTHTHTHAGPAPAISRLGINPYQWGTECLSGDVNAGPATSFPQALGMVSA